MEGLFYSTEEKILFYIPNHYTNGTGLLKVLYKNLQEAEQVLRQFQPISDIYCKEITTSTRYKYMWCFYTVLNECPKEAFELGKGWTVDKWISN